MRCNRIKRFAHFNSGLFKSKYDALIEKKLWMHEAETGLFGYGPIDYLPAIVDEKRSGEVTVIRIHSVLGLAYYYIISLNGTEIFVIRSGQHTKFKLNEGEHYIGVKCFGGWSPGWKEEFLDFSVTPNSSSFFKVAPNWSCAGIESITEEEALIKIENSKYVPMNKQYVVRSKTRPQVTNQPKEMQKSTSNSETTPTTKTTSQSQEAPKLASIPQDAPVVQVSLRNKPLKITEIEVTDMLLEYDFFESSMNTKGSFVNDFVDNNNGTITDKATGLMWQKSGSSSSLDNRSAKKYIKQLNRKRFAGHSDWRMPTVEELTSLLTRSRKSGVHIDPVFDHKQTICWTVDKYKPAGTKGRFWIVDFKQGQILLAIFKDSGKWRYINNPYNINALNCVKAVRSVK